MNRYCCSMLAVSIAGHDKDQTYVVLNMKDGFVYVADGKLKTIDDPKKKNNKHVQLIKNISEDILSQMQEIESDADLRRILKVYRNRRVNDQI